MRQNIKSLSTAALASVVVLAGVAAGCGPTYYRVTDPASGNIYYTTSVKEKSSGSVTLTDAATGNKVTLQNSEVTKVKKEEYETNRAGKK